MGSAGTTDSPLFVGPGGFRASGVSGASGSPPSPPTGFTAAGRDPYSHLTWEDEDSAAGYKVYRYKGADVETLTLLATLDGDTLEYDDYTGTPGELYNFYVVAFNEAGDSAPSDIASATPYHDEPPAPPDPPTGVDVQSIGHGLLVRWDEMPRALSYDIYCDDEYLASTTATNYADTGLDLGTLYVYKIVAVGETADSDFSTANQGYPGYYPPTSLAVGSLVVTDPPGFGLTFNASTDEDPGGNAYRIEYSLAGAESWTHVGDVYSPSATISGLALNSFYDVRVRMYGSGDGTVSPSPWVYLQGLITPPAAPSVNLTTDDDGNPAVAVTWAGVTGAQYYNVLHIVNDAPYSTESNISASPFLTYLGGMTDATNRWALQVSYDPVTTPGGDSPFSAVSDSLTTP